MISKQPQPLHHLALTDQSVLAARMESAQTPGRLADFRIFHFSDKNHEEALRDWLGVKPGRYVRAYCGVFPSSRFLHRMVPDGARAKDQAQMADWLANTAKVNVAENEVAVLRADGSQLEDEKSQVRELVFAGARTAEFSALQERLLSFGVYPARLELCTLPILASIRRISKAEGRATPALVVELCDAASHFHVVGEHGLMMTRTLAFGLDSMLPHVRAELGLSDDAVAKKILHTNTFDFTEMAPVLLRRLLREFRSATGQFEVETGVAPDRLYFANPTASFQWIYQFVAKSTNLELVSADLEQWPAAVGVEVVSREDLSHADPALWNLFALAGRYE